MSWSAEPQQVALASIISVLYPAVYELSKMTDIYFNFIVRALGMLEATNKLTLFQETSYKGQILLFGLHICTLQFPLLSRDQVCSGICQFKSSICSRPASYYLFRIGKKFLA